MFVDELKIFARAGKGGDGVALWLHEKGKEYSGPAGGNGGRGGDVYFVGVRDVGLLAHYRNTKEFAATNGQGGMKRSKTGADGDDLDVPLPIGSVIKNLRTGKIYRLEQEGERLLVLKGGNGGLGNEHFKASTNTRPKEFTLGKPGEEAEFYIELELVFNVKYYKKKYYQSAKNQKNTPEQRENSVEYSLPAVREVNGKPPDQNCYIQPGQKCKTVL
jgi:GTP-binding protein